MTASLEEVASEFGGFLERQVGQAIEEAGARAAEIERDAERRARHRERQSEQRAQEMLESVRGRAARVLDSIELVQTALAGMLGELRAELKDPHSQATSNAGAPPAVEPPPTVEPDKPMPTARPDKPPPAAEPEPPRLTETIPIDRGPAVERAPVESPTPAPRAGAQREKVFEEESRPAEEPRRQKHQPWGGQLGTEARRAEQERLAGLIYLEPEPVPPKAHAASNPRTADFDEMILAEIRRMFQDGKTREDVERFLGRFRLGDRYTARLDEIYPQHQRSSGRRGFRGRIQRRDR